MTEPSTPRPARDRSDEGRTPDRAGYSTATSNGEQQLAPAAPDHRSAERAAAEVDAVHEPTGGADRLSTTGGRTGEDEGPVPDLDVPGTAGGSTLADLGPDRVGGGGAGPGVGPLDRGHPPVVQPRTTQRRDATATLAVGADAPAVPPAPSTRQADLGLDRFLGVVPVAVTFVGPLDSPVTREVVRAFDDRHADFGRHRLQTLLVVPDADPEGDAPEDRVVLARAFPGSTVPVLSDPDGAWAARFGISPAERRVTTVFVDVDGSVVDVLVGDAGGVVPDEVLDRASELSLGAAGDGLARRVDG